MHYRDKENTWADHRVISSTMFCIDTSLHNSSNFNHLCVSAHVRPDPIVIYGKCQRAQCRLTRHNRVYEDLPSRPSMEPTALTATSWSHSFLCAKLITFFSVICPTTRSISSGPMRRPVVIIWRPISSALAVVPSKERRIDAFSWALARSTSASVTLYERRDHSRSVKWTRSSIRVSLSVTR